MNPLLDLLQPYPFEKLRVLLTGIEPEKQFSAISLGLGEPKHPTPQLIRQALCDNLDGLTSYPSTQGSEALREAISQWIARRYKLPAPDVATQILPATGSREALFAFAQAIVDASAVKGGEKPLVMVPNPFYQIYEGAALLAGAEPYFVNSDPKRNFAPDYSCVPDEVWARVQLLYVCSPGNPTGSVLSLAEWDTLFALAERHDFVIASDECYSEIYFDDNPPLSGLQAARLLGRPDYARLMVFSSLSKRSNAPGMRSGFVAGDAALIKKFLLYRTYHGSAMSPAVQAASVAAWNDEQHVIENRAKYAEKFRQVTPILQEVMDVALPDAGFFLWADISASGLTDTEFAQRLYAEYNVIVLPGSYIARDAAGGNPGRNRVRMALVAELDECLDAARRIAVFTSNMSCRCNLY